MSFRRTYDDKAESPRWWRQHRRALLDCGFPITLVDSDHLFHYALLHGDEPQTGWDVSQLSDQEAVRLFALLREILPNRAGYCLVDDLERRLRKDDDPREEAPEELIAKHGERLRSLVGRRVVRSWVVIYEPGDALHACSPVVLEVEDRTRLELWTIGHAGFGITWNRLDLGRPPTSWTGAPYADSRWVVDGDPALAGALPNTIDELHLLGAGRHGGPCAGIELSFGDGRRLVVANLADEVVLGTAAPHPDLVAAPWPSFYR